MDRKPAEYLTSPAIAAAVIGGGIYIAIRPADALLVLAGAELVAAAGCAVSVRTCLRHVPPVRPGAVLFAVFGLFWVVMTVLSSTWYFQGR